MLEGERGEVQSIEGECVALGDDSSSGKQAGGGRTRAHARRPRARPPGKGGDDREEPLVGWAGHLGRQVSPGEVPFSLSFYCFLFSIFCNCFGFIKNARAFSKIMKLFVGIVWNISSSNISVDDYLDI